MKRSIFPLGNDQKLKASPIPLLVVPRDRFEAGPFPSGFTYVLL